MQNEFATQVPDAAPLLSGGAEISMCAPAQALLATPDDAAKQTQAAIMTAAFLNVISRLEEILDLETEMLKQHRPIVLHDFNHKKSHGLLELSRAMDAIRALDRSSFDFDARTPLAGLRVKLESNLSMLRTHLHAVGEIAAIIARAIQDHESDGTYTAGANVASRQR